MLGAIIGDIVGSDYEFNNTLDYNFELFPHGSCYTDDTICTVAVADAILRGVNYRESLIAWCRKYPHPKGAYGSSFAHWMMEDDPQPYGSYGNGAAMRVSPVGWAFDTPDAVLAEAEKTAACSHSHLEGIKGAKATALAVWYLAHLPEKEAKKAVQELCAEYYGKDYFDRIPQKGQWDDTCQGCVPLALHLLGQSTSFEDAIRLAVSYGGDSDTLGAIVGSMAGACYDIPKRLEEKAKAYLPAEMKDVIDAFASKYCTKK